MSKAHQRPHVPQQLFELRDRYVTVAGEVASVSVETETDDRKIDHVWINVRAGEAGRVTIALSTCSRQSRAAGFDPRVRVATITSSWQELPHAGVREVAPLDYRKFDEAHPALVYEAHERAVVEEMLVGRARRAVFVEAWGEFYIRAHMGVHQIHSRRASHAVTRDMVGRDGAVQFYYPQPGTRELLLFKFDGQP